MCVSSYLQVRLAVAGAFHTRLMSSAVPKLEAALASTEFRAPKIPVISNVDALPHSDPEVIKAVLSQQVRTPSNHCENYSNCRQIIHLL